VDISFNSKLGGKSVFRNGMNRILHLLARNAPGARGLRPFLHRLRGVKVGKGVFIGDDVYLENLFPECVEIHDGAQLSVRATVIAHNRGPGKVVIGKQAYVGPHCVVLAPKGRTVTIGEGSVIGAATVITSNVPPFVFISPTPPQISGKVTVPLPATDDYWEFVHGLRPLRTKNSENKD
jgi:acetyltransferase-like isoleucine patch superfamily enzyme